MHQVSGGKWFWREGRAVIDVPTLKGSQGTENGRSASMNEIKQGM